MSSGNAGRILLWLLAVGVSANSSAQPDAGPTQPVPLDATAKLLRAIPADAGLVVVFRDLVGLDSHVTGLLNGMGISASPLTQVKRSIGVVSGFDEHGAAALAVLRVEPGSPMSAGLLLIVPTTNREELLTFLNPQPAHDGLVHTVVHGKDTYVAHRGGFTFLAPRPLVARKAVAAGKSIDEHLNEDQRRQIAREDISVFCDFDVFARTGLGSRFTAWLREQIGVGMPADRLKSVLVSAHADPRGISFHASFRHDASAGPQRVGASSTYLGGHIQEPFGLAMDVAVSQDMQRERVIVESVLAKAVRAGAVRSDRVAALRSAILGVLNEVTRVSLSVALLPTGGASQFGVSVILTARHDATLLVRAMENSVRAVKSGVLAEPRYSRLFQRLVWQRNAEFSVDVAIDQLRLPFGQLPGVDQKKAASLFTSEGLVLRIGAVENRQVVLTMGGGLARFDAIVANLRSGQAPLSSDVGIQLSRINMPSDRRSEGFVALDRLVPIWCHLTAVLGKDCEMPQFPMINALLAFYSLEASPTSTVYEGFVPVELLRGVREAGTRPAPR